MSANYYVHGACGECKRWIGQGHDRSCSVPDRERCDIGQRASAKTFLVFVILMLAIDAAVHLCR